MGLETEEVGLKRVVAARGFLIGFGNSEVWLLGVLGFSGLGARVTPSLKKDL